MYNSLLVTYHTQRKYISLYGYIEIKMKQFFLYIVFFLAIVLVSGAKGETYVFTENQPTKQEQEGKAHELMAIPAADPCITVCIAANSYADVTVANPSNFNHNSVRRYRPAGFSFDKLFIYLTAEKGVLQTDLYKKSLYYTQEHSALLKSGGYYIYALRKIVI